MHVMYFKLLSSSSTHLSSCSQFILSRFAEIYTLQNHVRDEKMRIDKQAKEAAAAEAQHPISQLTCCYSI